MDTVEIPADATIRQILEIQVDVWASLGHPALVERFVLAKGREYKPGPRKGHRMKAHMCYRNSVYRASRGFGTYVEGFVTTPHAPILIAHAWVTPDGETVMDPTLDAEGRQYFGVPFELEDVWEWMARLEVYGILDTGRGINTELIFAEAPELTAEVERVIGRELK